MNIICAGCCGNLLSQAALAAAAPYITPDADVDEILRNILSGKWK